MKKSALLLAALLILASPAFAQGGTCGTFDPAWTTCTTDQDCVAGKDACGAPAAYNKQSLEAAEKYAKCLAPMVDCAISVPRQGDPAKAPVCKSGTCSIAPAAPATP